MIEMDDHDAFQSKCKKKKLKQLIGKVSSNSINEKVETRLTWHRAKEASTQRRTRVVFI